jgi:hypothetical protein
MLVHFKKYRSSAKRRQTPQMEVQESAGDAAPLP